MRKQLTSILKVAVTGSAASGKTLVCKRLGELGVRVVSADVLARKAVAQGTVAFENIVAYFGKRVLNPNGHLDRRALRRIVFADDSARKTLEAFVHPEIVHLMQIEMVNAEKAGEPVIVVEVPLLFESGLETLFDLTVNVSAPFEMQIQRLMGRDKVSRDEARALLEAQLPDDVKSSRADIVLKNSGSIEQINSSVDSLYEMFSKLYRKNQMRLTDIPS